MFALDDIAVHTGLCKHQHDYIYSFANGYDDLDVEFIQPVGSSIGQRLRARSIQGAPTTDHTTNTADGYYFLFMNTNYIEPLPTVYIDTLSMTDIPRDTFETKSCIRFAYQKYGNVTLRVFISPINANVNYYTYAPNLWKTK